MKSRLLPALISCLCALIGNLSASVEVSGNQPQLAFAAEDLRAAMDEAGMDQFQVALAIQPNASSPESYRIQKTDSTRVVITGADANGTMYGGLALAEKFRLGLPVQDAEHAPYIKKRGIKFNIPLDARTPSYDDTGDSAQNNIATVWDFAFWTAYLDTLARYRYNVLSLWSTHPYPSLIQLEDYPDVALDDVYRIGAEILPEYNNKLEDLDQNGDGFLSLEGDANVLELVKEMSIQEKIAHWQRVFQYANDRGIEIYLFHWNVFTFGATNQYGITQDQTNPVTVDYTRKSVRQALLTYPQIVGIGVTAGENADRSIKGEHSTENFIYNTFGRAIMDVKAEQPEREIRFIFRRHVTEHPDVTAAFRDYTAGPVDTSIKYAVAHVYSSRRPQEWEKRIVEEGWLNDYKVWLNLRNDDIFMHRWGGPDYVRDFIRWMPREHSPGFYMGSDGYVWGREFISTNPETSGQLEIDKHWYRFRLWGQLAYDPDLGRDYWEAALAHRFPDIDATKLYDAWAATSEIVPQLNRAVWAATDGDFSAEGCMERAGFLTVDDYQFARDPMPLNRIDNAPDPQCVSVKDWAAATLAGQGIEGVTPLAVADHLDGFADAAQALLKDLRDPSESNIELRETLNDIESMAYLGRYYADKTRGAAKLALFRESGRREMQYHREAISHFTDAVEKWRTYAAILTTQYRPQLLARTHYLNWNLILNEVERELETVKQEGDFPEVWFANLNDGDALPEGADLEVKLHVQDNDGIEKVRLYLNGLLAKPGEAYIWNAASDEELLASLTEGWYQLETVAIDKTGVSSRRTISLQIGNPSASKKNAWRDEIHAVILEGDEQIVSSEGEETKINLPRLESWIAFKEDGKFIFRDMAKDDIAWKTFSKDEAGPHWAEFTGGQLLTYRGKPGDRKVLLWSSRKPPSGFTGPFKFGITRDKRVTVYQDKEETKKTVWISKPLD